jgi:hypothetical protein
MGNDFIIPLPSWVPRNGAFADAYNANTGGAVPPERKFALKIALPAR